MLTFLSIVIPIIILILIAKPLGNYLANIFDYENGKKSKGDKWLLPFENTIYKLSGLHTRTQTWKEYAFALLATNTLMIFIIYLIFRFQGVMPLNPEGVGSMEASLAFNTAISFMTNTNLQHYSGESGLSYLSQMIGILFMMFAAPATALAICMAFIRGITGKQLGNYFVDLIRGITRVLLPISIVFGLIFVALGMPQTLGGPVTVETVQGEVQDIAVGPVGSFLSIKELGNNGGGYFGVNSSHPFENPNGLSNMLQIILMFLITASLPLAYGKMARNYKQGWVLFIAMWLMFAVFSAVAVSGEYSGNPAMEQLGIAQSQPSMEGKEVRFTPAESAVYAVTTTATETGAVNNMHDSLTPLSGLVTLSNMMLNTIFGGIGAGFMNVIMYAMIAVFITGLMIGRTPEFLGKKLESKEMKIISITMLLHPLLILGFSALALATDTGSSAITNEGFHGISQVVYEYSSSAANNGSGFEGLDDDTLFWNVTTAITMFIGRFLPLVAMLAVASSLLRKKQIPASTGTFRTDEPIFGGLFIMSTIIVGALTFFPTLVIGPIAEWVTLYL
ncbi:potassium-transporting ATPase subunit A [Salipaludibacillus agaradhaerens]|jgi:K+-transporting ATPase ATPase A chain|uniref:Potassium-transporting ATPase potassium-binding subunit n=1 Tax=Salipaludibacillus agaradhaerens TaxID=76935 RepID=A0A9Q4FYV6_SALAG|nr:potassium-transporting ATPase subunit KdpA [Salipaludibacillus agaradhaerens]MCR6096138.1 potassium-transporting ATPase subunit A [Salipaludibacillus agaradhaerens]MCR6114303.1 potassium-transporting ATPase subunit A [Salipaludibacillus agaradhaerens]